MTNSQAGTNDFKFSIAILQSFLKVTPLAISFQNCNFKGVWGYCSKGLIPCLIRAMSCASHLKWLANWANFSYLPSSQTEMNSTLFLTRVSSHMPACPLAGSRRAGADSSWHLAEGRATGLDRSPVSHRADTWRRTTIHTHIRFRAANPACFQTVGGSWSRWRKTHAGSQTKNKVRLLLSSSHYTQDFHSFIP